MITHLIFQFISLFRNKYIEYKKTRETWVTLWGRASIDGVYSNLIPAKLRVSKDLIELQAFFGTYYFPKELVVFIEKKSNSKISFQHTVKNYPTEIIFLNINAFCTIQKQGYFSTADVKSGRLIPHVGSSLKGWVWTSICVFWNLVYLLPWDEKTQKIYALAVVSICIVLFIIILLSKKAQLIALKPERYSCKLHREIFVFLAIAFVFFLIIISDPYLCNKFEYFCKPEVFDWQ
jgi:hypothetical protein